MVVHIYHCTSNIQVDFFTVDSLNSAGSTDLFKPIILLPGIHISSHKFPSMVYAQNRKLHKATFTMFTETNFFF